MIQIARWKIIAVIFISLLGIAYTLPNFVNEEARVWMRSSLPAWAPGKTVPLGLDLRGGAHLLFAVDTQAVLGQREDRLVNDVRKSMQEQSISYTHITKTGQGVHLVLGDQSRMPDAIKVLRSLGAGMVVEAQPDGMSVMATLSDQDIQNLMEQTVEKAVAVVTRRVAETGSPDALIEREGENRILIQVPGGSTEYLKRIIGTTAQLRFELVEQNAQSLGGGINAVQPIKIQRPSMMAGEMMQTAEAGIDAQDNPYVSFRLTQQAAERFCALTKRAVNQPLAIVLDDTVLSAPIVREPICGTSGQITGDFDVQTSQDLALMLRAGALPAPLDILEERTVGASLGAGSLEAGKVAALIAVALVCVFMTLSYGLFGVMASVALVINMALIMGILSALQATLTLPGIAGIVLTIGMAVDANVLIFERVREDLRDGRSLVNAVESGFRRAMSTITDSNLTTLIAALILYMLGTGPIQGFAVTLGIGVITTLFSAIWLTSVMVGHWTNKHRNTTEMPV